MILPGDMVFIKHQGRAMSYTSSWWWRPTHSDTQTYMSQDGRLEPPIYWMAVRGVTAARWRMGIMNRNEKMAGKGEQRGCWKQGAQIKAEKARKSEIKDNQKTKDSSPVTMRALCFTCLLFVEQTLFLAWSRFLFSSLCLLSSFGAIYSFLALFFFFCCFGAISLYFSPFISFSFCLNTHLG